MSVDQNIKNDIDRSIQNRMSTANFEIALGRIITDIFQLRDPQPGDYIEHLRTAQHTSAYLSYRISSELMRSSNQAAQYDYALAVGRVLDDIYNNPIYGGAFSHRPGEQNVNYYGFRIFANFYSFHARLLYNGITFNGNTLFADVPRSYLTTIVRSTYGPSIGHIRIIGNDLPDPNIRVVSPSRSTYEASYIQIGTHRTDRISFENLRVATWNMQGSSATAEDKWRNGVSRLAEQNDIVCLQEFGTPPGAARYVEEHTVLDQFGNQYIVVEYDWNRGTSTLPRILKIYFFQVERLRVNLGFAYYEDRFRYHIHHFSVIADGINENRVRPAVGMEVTSHSPDDLRDAVSIFTFHALSGGGSNDPRMIREITLHTETPFAILGDFNRDPRPPDGIHSSRRGNWISPPQIAQITPANGDTHGSGTSAAMLDYAVTNGTMPSTSGQVVPNLPSDHRAVNMIFSFCSDS